MSLKDSLRSCVYLVDLKQDFIVSGKSFRMTKKICAAKKRFSCGKKNPSDEKKLLAQQKRFLRGEKKFPNGEKKVSPRLRTTDKRGFILQSAAEA